MASRPGRQQSSPWSLVRAKLVVPGSPIDLAVLRIVFFVVALPVGLSRVPSQMATLPDELQRVPTGAGWIYWALPPAAEPARWAAIVMVLAALAAIFGLRARLAAAVWGITAVWVLGIPNLFGKVDHYHHLVWLALLLAASPCADALALDARRRVGGPSAPHVRYGLPVRLTWLLLGLIYFFAGLWKVGEQGLAWATPGNLRPLLHGQWAVVDDFTPLVRVDQWPAALLAMGIFTILFELGFVFVAFSRQRWLAPAAGVCFHLSTYALLNISFVDLMALYVAFVPWSETLGAAPDREPVELWAAADRPTRWFGAVLVAGVLAFGLTATVDGWPLASYPTFGTRYGPVRTVLEFEVDLNDGTTLEAGLDEVFAWVPASRRTRLASQFLGLDADDQAEVLRQVDLLGDRAADARMIRVYEVAYRTDPEDPGVAWTEQVAEVEVEPGAP